MEHVLIPPEHVHAPHTWRVADAEARLALTPAAGDEGKYCWQQDDNSEWLLVGNDPVTWRRKNGTDVFEQATPLDTWTVAHNLGRYPAVTVTDHLGAVLLADVQYVDANTVQVNHSVPMIGKVYCN